MGIKYDKLACELIPSALVLLLFCVFSSLAQRSSDTPNNLPKELEVVENWIHDGGQSGMKSRFIFIYLPESSFSEKNLSMIFDKYQKDYCDPYILSIDAYSDRAMLDKKRKWEKSAIFVDFKDDAAGQKAATEFYGRVLPAPSGYYQAEYNRYGDYELFDFTRTKDSPEQTRIMIRDPSAVQTAPNVCKLPH